MSSTAKDLASHFAFGENWASYAQGIDEERIAEAERGLTHLVGETMLTGRSFLDIGCGSGIHALAAFRLGARQVTAIDIDPVSAATTEALLRKYAPSQNYRVHHVSVFDLPPDKFDIVYSWGVLHHTGAMEEAIERTAQCVAPNGLFVFALYRQTLLCPLWTLEKRWYSKAGPRAQGLAQSLFVAARRLGFRVKGRDFAAFVANYKGKRGMDFRHDVHDWLGGYPYESISPAGVERLMTRLGFRAVRSFTRPQRWGLFGAGCDEYVYRAP